MMRSISMSDLPRVTEVLAEAGLIDTTWLTPEGAERGTYVHRACQYYDENDLDEDSLDAELKGYLAGWKKFRRESDIKGWTWVEWPMRGILYRGTPDRICVGEPSTLLDIKSGGYLPYHRWQTAAYVGLLENPYRYRRMCVYLTKTGKYSVRIFPKEDYLIDMNTFTAALNLYYVKQEHGLLKERDNGQ
jgi:hypothetical protein